jgi:hypothetical protein
LLTFQIGWAPCAPVVGSIDQCRSDVAASLRKVDYFLFDAKISRREDAPRLSECICRVTQQLRACRIQFGTRRWWKRTKRPGIVGDARQANVRGRWGDSSGKFHRFQRGGRRVHRDQYTFDPRRGVWTDVRGTHNCASLSDQSTVTTRLQCVSPSAKRNAADRFSAMGAPELSHLSPSIAICVPIQVEQKTVPVDFHGPPMMDSVTAPLDTEYRSLRAADVTFNGSAAFQHSVIIICCNYFFSGNICRRLAQ